MKYLETKRFTEKLTIDVIAADYDRETADKRSFSTGQIILMVFSCVFFTWLGILITGFLIYRKWRNNNEYPEAKNISFDQVEIRETVCTGKRVMVDPDGPDDYYLTFSGFREMNVNRAQRGSGTSCPAYEQVQKGDAFWAVGIKAIGVGGFCAWLFYRKDKWRICDLTEEMIAWEIQAEEEAVEQIMAAEKFPRLVARKAYFLQTEPTLHRVSANKASADMNLIERLAATGFGYDLIAAVEYVVRYCPEYGMYFNDHQQKLSNVIRIHIGEEEKAEAETKRKEERKKKIREMFGDYLD